MRGHSNISRGTGRRAYLGTIATGTAFALAGCMGSVGSDELEVIHGWTGGDGEAAINALTEAFEENHSDIETNFEASGGEGNAQVNSVVQRRLTNSNPMSSFANWPGANLENYENGLMDIEEDVWDAEGFKDTMQERVIDLCTYNDQMVAVPIGSHRMNNLFYNTAAFDEAGVDAEELGSVSDLIDALGTIDEETDYTPFAHGMDAGFLGLQTFAQILTSQSGVDAYTDFIDGNGDRDAMLEALESLQEIRENYITDDASSIGYTEAAQYLISDDAACMHGGNWMYGMFREDDEFNFGEEWDWVPFPGTEGIYFYHVDAFIAVGDNPTPEDTVAWQQFVGSQEAQIAFNELKGSVPLRNDIDSGELPEFLALNYEDLLESTDFPPTIAHGLAVGPEAKNDCEGVIANEFSDPFNPEATVDGLLDAVSE